jgi:hypothetical protein
MYGVYVYGEGVSSVRGTILATYASVQTIINFCVIL